LSRRTEPAPGDLEQTGTIRAVGDRKRLILVATLLLVAATLGLSYVQTPVYQATTELFLQPSAVPMDGVTSNNAKGGDPNAVAVNLLQGPIIRQRVADQLGRAPKIVAVSAPGSIQVTAESTDPKRAAAVADAYVHQYLEFRKSQDTEALNKAIADLEPRYTDNQRRVNEIDRQIAGAAIFARESLERQLGPERSQRLSQANADLQLLNEYRLQLDRTANTAVVVTPARVPEDPVRPKPLRNAALRGPGWRGARRGSAPPPGGRWAAPRQGRGRSRSRGRSRRWRCPPANEAAWPPATSRPPRRCDRGQRR
jgi:hypothetical protein